MTSKKWRKCTEIIGPTESVASREEIEVVGYQP